MGDEISPIAFQLHRDVEMLRQAKQASILLIYLATIALIVVYLVPNAMSMMVAGTSVVMIAYYSCILRICSLIVPQLELVDSLYDIPNYNQRVLDFISNRFHHQMRFYIGVSSSCKIPLVLLFVHDCSAIVFYESTNLNIVWPLTLCLMMTVFVQMGNNIRKKLSAIGRLLYSFRAIENLAKEQNIL